MSGAEVSEVWLAAGRSLEITAVSRSGAVIPWATLAPRLLPVFDELVPWLSPGRHCAVLQDVPGAADRRIAGHCGNAVELTLLLPGWTVSPAELQGAFAHELHHMARRRHAGYGRTLGEVVVSEAMALWYEARWRGHAPPLVEGDVAPAATAALLAHWHDADFDHDAWFVAGRFGERIGYRLAWQSIRHASAPLTLFDSLILTAAAWRPALEALDD